MSEEALQIAEERRKAKGKGERERYTHLNADFQRRAKRDKKAFLNETVRDYFVGDPKSLQMVTTAMKLKKKTFAPWKKSYNKPRQCIKKQGQHFANKSL